MATPEKSRIPNSSEWISKSEAARLRGVSRQAIWELVKRGRLRPSTINGRAYLKRADVLSFKYGKRGPYSRVPAAEVLARFQAEKAEKAGKPAKAAKFDPAKWLSLTEAANALGLTHPAVSDLVRRRRFKTMMIADKTLIARSSVQKFKSRQRGPKTKSQRGKKK